MATETSTTNTSWFTNTGTDDILDKLSDAGLHIVDSGNIRNFLLAHPHITEALPSVVREAHDQLGEDTELFLQTDDPYLVLLVRRPEYNQHVVDITDALTMSVLQLDRQDAYFLVRTDFVLSSAT